MKATRYWAFWGAAVCAVALAGQPPPPPSPSSDAARPAPRADASGNARPDDEFIEFLGADDVDDAAWAEFLKKSAQRKGQTPAAPPQGVTQ